MRLHLQEWGPYFRDLVRGGENILASRDVGY